MNRRNNKNGINKKIKSILSAAGAAVLAIGLLAGCGAAQTEEDKAASAEASTQANSQANAGSRAADSGRDDLKVALVMKGSTSDGSWNAGAYEGIQWLEENRDDVKVSYVENISVDDSALALQNLIDEGNDVIIAFASEYSDVIDTLAEENPDVYFVDTNIYGKDRPANVAALNGNQGQGAFLVGVIAASLSKSGKVGSVEGFDYGDLSENYVNFEAGAKYVNPEIETVISYVGSWTDVEKAKQTAIAQIESGVDFIYASGDLIGTGIIAGCKEKNVSVIGYGKDLNELAPEQVISSVNWNSGISFNSIIEKIQDGTFKNTVYSASLADGSISLADYHGLLRDDIVKKVDEVKQGIIDGEIKTVSE